MKKETYFASAMSLALLGSGSAMAAAASDTPPVGPVDGVIGYILTDEVWAVYQTPEGKQECPDGLNA